MAGACGSAVQTGESVGADMAGLVYIAPCSSMGASNPGRPVSAFATDVWLMSGKVLELTDQQASVQVGWRRIRSGGQEESSPEQIDHADAEARRAQHAREHRGAGVGIV